MTHRVRWIWETKHAMIAHDEHKHIWAADAKPAARLENAVFAEQRRLRTLASVGQRQQRVPRCALSSLRVPSASNFYNDRLLVLSRAGAKHHSVRARKHDVLPAELARMSVRIPISQCAANDALFVSTRLSNEVVVIIIWITVVGLWLNGFEFRWRHRNNERDRANLPAGLRTFFLLFCSWTGNSVRNFARNASPFPTRFFCFTSRFTIPLQIGKNGRLFLSTANLCDLQVQRK